MSIWTDKKGRRHVGIMVDGRRVHRILPADATAGVAKQLEADLRASLAVSKTPGIPSDPRLTEIIALYVEHAEHLRSTKKALDHARRITLWLEKYRASQARQCAAHIVRDMTGHYAAGTINRSLGTLKKALGLAWERGITATDYSAHVKRRPENNARSVYLSVDQVQALASRCSLPVQAAIWTALLTGARRGEICKLQKADIGSDSLIIHAGNTKTLRTRSVPIVPALRPWLKHIPLEVGIEGIKSAWRRARVDAGLPDVNFHDLRHSCASILIATGCDLFTVSKILGHSSVKTTERYAHLEMDQQRRAMLKAFKIK